MTMKIAIIGSRGYTNKRKIKEFIFQLKNKFEEDLVIVKVHLDMVNHIM